MMYSIEEKKIVWKRARDEVVILNLTTGFYYTLNSSGAVVWDGILNDWTVERIAEKICDTFEIDRLTAIRDASECVARLSAEGIITVDTAH